MKLISVIILCSFIASCATLDKSACETVDWRELGKTDGAKGYTSKINKYNKDCGKHGITTNPSQYASGRTEGLKHYCTYENGVIVGQSGATYNNVCSGQAHNEFFSSYQPYYNVAKTKLAITYKQSDIQSTEKEFIEEKERSKKEVLATKLGYKKGELNGLEYDLKKYEQILSTHIIDREILMLTKELNSPGVSPEEKIFKSAKIAELQDKKSSSTKDYKYDRAVGNLEKLKNLFK